MTPQTFIQKWGPGGPAFHLNEEQGAQSHFLDLCELLGVPKPGSEDGYLFEEKNAVIGGRTGYADVFRRGAFAWENKAPGKNLDAALKQLLTYSLALSNPPILVVCDRLTLRIHTQFTGHPTETHTLTLAEFDQPDKLALLRRIWTDPESFRPKKTSRDITEAAAKSFAALADSLRKRGAAKDEDATAFQARADEVAHFLTQCLFCFFAEDVGLLPGRMFEGLVNNRKLTSDKLTGGLRNLFTVMRDGGLYGNDDIPWFNGGLFKKIAVPELSVLEVTELRNAAALNWSAIDVSIFGTLFERGLDPSKRSQLGAHYTDPATIMRIVEPVLQRPLLQIWDQTAAGIKALLAKSKKKNDASYKAARVKFIEWLDQLENYRVLDPACGSGNFLFLGLKTLKDIEHKSHLDAAAMGLDREADLVTGPHNMLGIELNEYAAELARVTVWIGELQWRLMHGYEFKTNPVLEPLDHIECRDALLSFVVAGADPVEAAWPKASVVIGNPPFLGGSKKR
ncbi:MAG: DNA methyltransferase, partial [Pseudomonadota bacterium]